MLAWHFYVEDDFVQQNVGERCAGSQMESSEDPTAMARTPRIHRDSGVFAKHTKHAYMKTRDISCVPGHNTARDCDRNSRPKAMALCFFAIATMIVGFL